MPQFSFTPPQSIESSFLNTVVADRIAEKEFEEPNWLTGKKRLIGGILLLAGFIGQMTGHPIPEDQLKTFWGWLEANWDNLAYGAGLLMGIWGTFSAQFRHNKEKEVIKEVAKDLVADVQVLKAELVEEQKKP